MAWIGTPLSGKELGGGTPEPLVAHISATKREFVIQPMTANTDLSANLIEVYLSSRKSEESRSNSESGRKESMKSESKA